MSDASITRENQTIISDRSDSAGTIQSDQKGGSRSPETDQGKPHHGMITKSKRCIALKLYSASYNNMYIVVILLGLPLAQF